MTLEETCAKLRERLSAWYRGRKLLVGQDLRRPESLGSIRPVELSEEVDKFFAEFPELSEHRRDIFWNFDVVEGSYSPGCLDGCCEPRARVRGVVVEPICWDRVFGLATGPGLDRIDWTRQFQVGEELLKHYPFRDDLATQENKHEPS